MSIVRSITFGKTTKQHPCNTKHFRVYGGLNPDDMVLLQQGVLKNDAQPETLQLNIDVSDHLLLPCRYIKVEPLTAHGSFFNLSIWHIALHGQTDPEVVEREFSDYASHRGNEAFRLILKHLRQRALLDSFDTLLATVSQPPHSVRLEHPFFTQLHKTLVIDGAFDLVEALLSKAAFRSVANLMDEDSEPSLSSNEPSLFEMHAQTKKPQAIWNRLDSDPTTLSVDGEKPESRGGHRLVFVPADPEQESGCASLYLFGGFNGQEELADFWRYDLPSESRHDSDSQARWNLISRDTRDHGGPSPRSCHGTCVDTETGDIYILGRFVKFMEEDTDAGDVELWRYHTRGTLRGAWDSMNRDNSPGTIWDHQMVIDQTSKQLYVFGGKKAKKLEEPQEYSGLFRFDLTNETWTQLCSDPGPSDPYEATRLLSRASHALSFNPAQRRLHVLGGSRCDSYLCDSWSIALDTTETVPLSLDWAHQGGPNGNFTLRAELCGQNELIVLLGCMTASKGREVVSSLEVWTHNLSHGRWTKIQDLDGNGAEEPVPRFGAQMALDPATQTLYLFGGNPSSESNPADRLDDFWSLRLERSLTPEIVLNKAKFAVRKQKFIELCATQPPLVALQYLQTSLAKVVGKEAEQIEAFQQCMQHLLSAPLADTDDAEMNGQPPSLASSKDDIMASSQGLPLPLTTAQASERFWEQRTRLFEDLLQFFPRDAISQQPVQELVSLIH